MRSAIACRGSSAATCSTKLPLPCFTASPTIWRERDAIVSSSSAIERGVKPRLTIARCWVWCGGSWLSRIVRCSSICSRCIPSEKRMIAPFSSVDQSLEFFETAATSACRVTAK